MRAATAVMLGFMLGAAMPALAQGEAKDTGQKAVSEKQQRQQARFKDCTQQAQGRKGDDRKQFMSACLRVERVASADTSGGKRPAQANKMSSCSKEAAGKQLKGAERKQFMSACLSK